MKTKDTAAIAIATLTEMKKYVIKYFVIFYCIITTLINVNSHLHQINKNYRLKIDSIQNHHHNNNIKQKASNILSSNKNVKRKKFNELKKKLKQKKKEFKQRINNNNNMNKAIHELSKHEYVDAMNMRFKQQQQKTRITNNKKNDQAPPSMPFAHVQSFPVGGSGYHYTPSQYHHPPPPPLPPPPPPPPTLQQGANLKNPFATYSAPTAQDSLRFKEIYNNNRMPANPNPLNYGGINMPYMPNLNSKQFHQQFMPSSVASMMIQQQHQMPILPHFKQQHQC